MPHIEGEISVLRVKGVGKMRNQKTVGVFRISEPTVFRNSSFETACNWQDIEVPAGDYPVSSDGFCATVKMAGTVVKSNFVNRLGSYSSLEDPGLFNGKARNYFFRAGIEYLKDNDPRFIPA